MIKKYVWLLWALWLPWCLASCSKDDDPVGGGKEENTSKTFQDEKPYANFFGYQVMNDVYLWKKEIASGLKNWDLMADPVETVKKIRYKKAAGDDIDKWTQMTDAYSEMVGGTDGVSTGTYGLGLELYMKSKDSDAVVGFITYTYPDSPAEKAGLKRGDVILEVDGKEMNKANYYQALFASTSLQVGVGTYEGNNVYSAVKKTVSMQSKAMYEDPILLTKVFDCGGKKVGYLAYTNFTFESSLGLYNVCKEFKSQGITELILDLRYNGGGYVFTEGVFASMLAPEAEVKKGSVFQTEVWNDEYMAYFKKQGDDLNTYFKTKHVASHADKKYDINTSDANLGLTKIYALVTENSASASEAILIGLMPYMDIEVIGTRTHGKYCSGIMWKGEEWYQDIADNYKEDGKSFAKEIPELADWKKYIGDWGIYVMISMYADKDGKNPCMPDGLTPDVETADLFEEPYPLGDEREAMLHVALKRAGKTDLAARAVTRSVGERPVGKELPTKKHFLNGKRIYTGKLIKSCITE